MSAKKVHAFIDKMSTTNPAGFNIDDARQYLDQYESQNNQLILFQKTGFKMLEDSKRQFRQSCCQIIFSDIHSLIIEGSLKIIYNAIVELGYKKEEEVFHSLDTFVQFMERIEDGEIKTFYRLFMMGVACCFCVKSGTNPYGNEINVQGVKNILLRMLNDEKGWECRCTIAKILLLNAFGVNKILQPYIIRVGTLKDNDISSTEISHVETGHVDELKLLNVKFDKKMTNSTTPRQDQIASIQHTTSGGKDYHTTTSGKKDDIDDIFGASSDDDKEQKGKRSTTGSKNQKTIVDSDDDDGDKLKMDSTSPPPPRKSTSTKMQKEKKKRKPDPYCVGISNNWHTSTPRAQRKREEKEEEEDKSKQTGTRPPTITEPTFIRAAQPKEQDETKSYYVLDSEEEYSDDSDVDIEYSTVIAKNVVKDEKEVLLAFKKLEKCLMDQTLLSQLEMYKNSVLLGNEDITVDKFIFPYNPTIALFFGYYLGCCLDKIEEVTDISDVQQMLCLPDEAAWNEFVIQTMSEKEGISKFIYMHCISFRDCANQIKDVDEGKEQDCYRIKGLRTIFESVIITTGSKNNTEFANFLRDFVDYAQSELAKMVKLQLLMFEEGLFFELYLRFITAIAEDNLVSSVDYHKFDFLINNLPPSGIPSLVGFSNPIAKVFLKWLHSKNAGTLYFERFESEKNKNSLMVVDTTGNTSWFVTSTSSIQDWMQYFQSLDKETEICILYHDGIDCEVVKKPFSKSILCYENYITRTVQLLQSFYNCFGKCLADYCGVVDRKKLTTASIIKELKQGWEHTNELVAIYNDIAAHQASSSALPNQVDDSTPNQAATTSNIANTASRRKNKSKKIKSATTDLDQWQIYQEEKVYTEKLKELLPIIHTYLNENMTNILSLLCTEEDKKIEFENLLMVCLRDKIMPVCVSDLDSLQKCIAYVNSIKDLMLLSLQNDEQYFRTSSFKTPLSGFFNTTLSKKEEESIGISNKRAKFLLALGFFAHNAMTTAALEQLGQTNGTFVCIALSPEDYNLEITRNAISETFPPLWVLMNRYIYEHDRLLLPCFTLGYTIIYPTFKIEQRDESVVDFSAKSQMRIYLSRQEEEEVVEEEGGKKSDTVYCFIQSFVGTFEIAFDPMCSTDGTTTTVRACLGPDETIMCFKIEKPRSQGETFAIAITNLTASERLLTTQYGEVPAAENNLPGDALLRIVFCHKIQDLGIVTNGIIIIHSLFYYLSIHFTSLFLCRM